MKTTEHTELTEGYGKQKMEITVFPRASAGQFSGWFSTCFGIFTFGDFGGFFSDSMDKPFLADMNK